ncbi:hypothetical protein BFP78_04640 [Gaetbulibacter sp. 5U11]|nr:hypothetical protein BFP78_04640 [Gaetbulibacter sp. 5U11]
MKKIYFLLFTLTSVFTASAQLQAGDIAFIAFNADGGDDFAFVALADIPANTVIFLTDNEPDTTPGTLTSGEGILQYTSPSTDLNAGTVVIFSDASTTSRGVNFGTIISDSGSFNLAAGGDALFAYIGSANAPTTFLAGIQNESNNEGDLNSAGLVEGDTFFTFTASGNPDGGKYTGPRTDETAFSDYRVLINDINNWITDTSNGESILPIDDTVFTIPTLSTTTFKQSEFSVFPNPTSNGFVNIKTANNQPVAVVAYDVLGKQVLNTTLTTSRLNVSNLKAGVYILKLTQNGATTTKKLVIE